MLDAKGMRHATSGYWLKGRCAANLAPFTCLENIVPNLKALSKRPLFTFHFSFNKWISSASTPEHPIRLLELSLIFVAVHPTVVPSTTASWWTEGVVCDVSITISYLIVPK